MIGAERTYLHCKRSGSTPQLSSYCHRPIHRPPPTPDSQTSDPVYAILGPRSVRPSVRQSSIHPSALTPEPLTHTRLWDVSRMIRVEYEYVAMLDNIVIKLWDDSRLQITLTAQRQVRIQRGGDRGSGPPLENHKLYRFL